MRTLCHSARFHGLGTRLSMTFPAESSSEDLADRSRLSYKFLSVDMGLGDQTFARQVQEPSAAEAHKT